MLSEYEQNLSKVLTDIIIIRDKKVQKTVRLYRLQWKLQKKQIISSAMPLLRRLRAHTWGGGAEGEVEMKFS